MNYCRKKGIKNVISTMKTITTEIVVTLATISLPIKNDTIKNLAKYTIHENHLTFFLATSRVRYAASGLLLTRRHRMA